MNPEEIRQRCEVELPGRLESLCIDAHQRCDPANGTVQVMLVAVKRDVLEGYRRIFSGARRYVVRVTTDEISRYNVAVQCDRGVRAQKVMLVWIGKERAEMAVWDCGVRVAGCSLGAERRLPSHYTQHQVKPEFHYQAISFGDRLREIAISVEKLLSDERDSVQSIERVLCWGPLMGDRLVREAFKAMVPSRAPVSWLEESMSPGTFGIGGVSAFDSSVCTDDYNEALGAVLPELMIPNAPVGLWRKSKAKVCHREPKRRWSPRRFVEGGI